ncbi:MAG TPA: hypothetical protein VLL25_20250 [Acidimicrobiales bacterium]|nr:hypothetical protein [Acidimicrobiales bacterium]
MAMRRYTDTHEYLKMLRRMVKAAGTRVGHADPEDLAELIAIRTDLDTAIRRAVDGLRADGFTWQSIGDATGTTRQAALMKWSH